MLKKAAEDDILLNSDNSVFILIDYQPTQVNSINSMNRAELIKNIVVTQKLINGFKIPTILSTVNVATGKNKDTIPQLKELLPNVESYDRTQIDAWEDQEFYDAVKASGKKNIIIAALWTEACLSFPTFNALKEGYHVFPVVDAVGGTSKIAHETALRRMEQAGAQLTTVTQLACELQRDWGRKETVPAFVEAMTAMGDFLELG